MFDDVGICNLALSRIGVTVKIDSFDARSQEAIELKAVYELVRDRVLGAAPWPFAKRVDYLQKTGATPVRWAFRYEYPNDCVRVRAIYPPPPAGTRPEQFRVWLRVNRVPYELELDETGAKTIVTDQDTAIIEYTKRIVDPSLFEAAFASTFAWGLAAEIALSLAKTVDHAKNAGAMYQQAVNEALAAALNEEVREDPPESEFVRARL